MSQKSVEGVWKLEEWIDAWRRPDAGFIKR
jgi:hypothetical protein